MKKRTVMMIAASMFLLGFYIGNWKNLHPIIDVIVVGLYILVNFMWYAAAKREFKQQAEDDFHKLTKEIFKHHG